MSVFTGIPEKGKGRARGLGFPTINISLAGESLSGIFAARVSFGGKGYHAVAFADSERGILEAHIVEPFSGEVAGEVQIQLEKKIRDSHMFSTDEELIRAIERDVLEARSHFNI